MVDKQTKRKLKRFWCEQLVIGLCVFIALGFSIVKVQSVFRETNLIWKAQAYHQAQQAYPQMQQVYQQVQQAQQAYQQTQQAQQAQQAYQQAQQALQQTPQAYQQAYHQAQQQAQQQAYQQTQQQAFQQAYQQTQQAYQQAQQAHQQAYEQALQALQQAYEQALQQAYQQEQQAFQQAYQAKQQKLQLESLFLVISALCFMVILLLLQLLRERNQMSLTLTGQLICFFPEEYIAELGALHKQMKSEQRSNWVIRMIMLKNILELFLAFYVQINIENLWLPQYRGRKNIDE